MFLRSALLTLGLCWPARSQTTQPTPASDVAVMIASTGDMSHPDGEGRLIGFRPTKVAVDRPRSEVEIARRSDAAGLPSGDAGVRLAVQLAQRCAAPVFGIGSVGDDPEMALIDGHVARMATLSRAGRTPRPVDDDFGGFYRSMLREGARKVVSGAWSENDAMTAWYCHNFEACGNVLRLASAGDRIVVFYDNHRAFLLRRCLIDTPGFRLV